MRYTILIAFLLFGGISFGQQITIKAESNNSTPEVGDNFQINYIIESPTNLGNSKLIPKSVSGLKYLNDGKSTGSSVSIINGKYTASYTLNYAVAYLAEKAGEYIIPPLEIAVDGKTYRSNSVKIVVSAVDQNKIVRSEQYYLDIALNKKSVYVGEPLTYTLKYYSQFNINNLRINADPEFKGFYKKDLTINNQSSVKNINGKQHVVGTYKQALLIPLEAGNHVIPKLTGTISLISQGYGFFQQTEEKKIYSNSVTINVKPFPENGKPASFSGAVGSFSISGKVDKNHVKTNDAISYKVTIKGSGNLKMTELPKIAFPEDFEVYDPKITENITADASGMSGQKTYEYILIPKHAGQSTIPSLEFSFFNPANQSYQKIKTEETIITVDQGDGSTTAVVSKEDLKFAKKDIHYFSVDTNNLEQGEKEPFLFSPLFWILLILPQAATLTFIIIKREKKYSSSEIISSKNKNAAKLAAKRLKDAEKLLQSTDSKAFYGEVLKAMNSYFSDKFNIPQVNLNKEIIIEELQKKGVSENDIKATMSIVEKCEMARYAPVNDAISDVYSKALEQITKIES